MKTTVTPHGTVVEIHYKDKIYYCLLVVDFDMYKTYGNQDIDTDYLVFWDEEYQLIPYVNPLYEVLSEIVKKKVIDEKDEEDSIRKNRYWVYDSSRHHYE